MKLKYAPLRGTEIGTPGQGRKRNPETWKTGPDPVVRDKYYAYLRHRAQANHRGEDYTLTWEDWQELWQPTLWANRGRHSTGQCLGRLDWTLGWHRDNVEVMSRRRHFEIKVAHNDRS